MKKLCLLLLLIICSCNSKQSSSINNETENTSYYFIRHAEKDRSDKMNKNPKLIEKGEKRALKWSQTLKNIHFDAIYSTNYARTKETATPTALKNNLDLTIYSPTGMDYELFKKKTLGKTVLIVGHSNTTPSFVNAILGEKKYENINDNNNANLYLVTIINNKVSDQLLYIN